MTKEAHDGLKRYIRTQEVGIRMIRVAQVTDQRACPSRPMRRSTAGHHGHSRIAPQASWPGLKHVSRSSEES
jgi:hypothetical protein